MKLKKLLSVLLAAAMVVGSVQLPAASVEVKAAEETVAETGNPLRLWYDEPASQGQNILSAGSGYSEADGSNTWQQQTLPIGNGDMGANVYGEIVSEHLTFNEKTLWTGGPSASRPNYNGGNNVSKGNNGSWLKTIQQEFLKGNSSYASQLCGTYLVGDSAGYGAYQAWGDIYFDYKNISTNVTNYERDLDLTTATAGVSFTENGTNYTREFFVNHDDNVLVGRLTADGAAKLNFDVRFTSKQGATPVAEGNNTIKLCGQVSDNQLKFASYLTVVAEDGTVTAANGKVTVSNATAVTVYVSAATDYKNTFYDETGKDDYYYRTGETAEQLQTRVKADVNAAVALGYNKVKENHLADYQEMFNRVNLQLGQTVSAKTTDQLLAAYKNGTASEAEKRQLEVMLFQYGRYLTLGSSREDSQLPSNLQGVWNCLNNPPWASDYHMNVNLQMNYWPTYSTNLAECALPLIDYVDSLREPGRVTAQIYFGVGNGPDEATGYSAHTQNTPFGWTCPGWSFDWGWSPAAVPWILQNCWEYYEFTGDAEFMAEYIYPMLKEEAVFYNKTLVQDENGLWVSAPSYSPEHGPRTAGNTYEQSLTWQLYEDAITAAEIVGEKDTALVAEWKDKQANLKGPIEVGEDGQLKEWYEETTITSMNSQGADAAGHRHLSHMLGLFPGDLVAQKDEWLEAARVSMDYRTDNSTGWGMGQRINTWARLGDGNKAHELIGNLFKGGIYPNLWDSHSPFQIDGNFGMTSGVAEMLVQSNMGFIDLLPALPDAWADGSVEGLVARGNFELDMKWAATSLTEVKILSRNGGECIVNYVTADDAKVLDENGKEVAVTVVEDGRISFATEKGKTYTITEIPERPLEAPSKVSAFYMGSEAVVSFEGNVLADEYVVYASTDGENYTKVATTKETEVKVDNYVYGTTYKVAGVAEGVEGQLSKAIVPTVLELTTKIDDRDARITYSSEWGNWSESAQYKGTEKYCGTAGATAEFYFFGKSISVIGMKNTDCHTFDLYIDGELVAENVDTNASACKRQETFVTKEVEEGIHKVKLVVKQGKISLDAFEFAFDYVLEAKEIVITGKNKLNMTVDTTLQLGVEYLPAGSTGTGVNWSVDNEAVATIDANGLLTAKKPGTVVVTATYKDDASIKATKTITITQEAPEPEAFDMAVLAGNAIANSEMNPANGTDGPASWAFDNEAHWWHSRWGAWDQRQDYETVTQAMTGKPSASNPIWIQTGFDQVFYIDHIDYSQRSNGFGSIKDYKVLVANLEDPTAMPSDADFTEVKSGSLTGSATSTIQLDEPVAATHVRIVATSVISGRCDGHVAAQKIAIYGYDKLVNVEPTPEVTEAPKPTETEAPQPTITETPKPTVTEAPIPTETEAPQPTATPEATEDVKTVFTDVYKDWYTDYVQYVYDNGLMTGIKGTTQFQPNANITKAQVAQVLYNMEGQPAVTEKKVFNELSDVYAGEWYANAVAWAYNTGVVTGDTNAKKFFPNADVTREQLALMMFRYASYKKYDVSASSDLAGLKNAENVNNWAADGVKWAVGAGLISGVEKNGVKDLQPQGNASRAQVAAILQRFCENVK